MGKSKKKLFIGILFLSIFLAFIPPARAIEVDTGSIYITSGDVIRNFKIESFGGKSVTSGGTVTGLNDRLKIESGAGWICDPDEIVIQYAEQVGDTLFLKYDVPFTQKFNIYTNVDLNGAVETGKSGDPIIESFVAGVYAHYGCFGGAPQIYRESYLYWHHLDVGNTYAHNRDFNTFTGEIVMSCDIDPSPIPDTITDPNGNTAHKNFDFIGISSIYVSDSTSGMLSDTAPYVVGLTPSQFDSEADTVPDVAKPEGFLSTWNPDVSPGRPFISSTYSVQTIPPPVGTGLNPTLKNGLELWDPEEAEASVGNVTFSLGISRLAPLITTYQSTMSYNLQTCSSADTWTGVAITGYSSTKYTETRTTALHVTNRYIQTEITMRFSVWSSYQVEAIASDLPELQYPQEYYDLLVFNSVIDGFGGGVVYTDTPNPIADFIDFVAGIFTGPIGTIIMMIIGLIAVVVILYIVFKFIIFKKSRPSSSTGSGSAVYISTK